MTPAGRNEAGQITDGARFGPYEVLGRLGSGGMGDVYRARDPRLGREVAVKVLPVQLGADPERLRRFANEARAAGVMLGGYALDATSGATTVRVRDAQTLVTDGPYAEAKEVLGGYFLLDCRSFDEALEWAARIPAAESGAIEVRQVHVDEDEEEAA